MCTTRFNCGFAGAKLLVYEGGIRLPMVLRWPAGLDGNRTQDGLVHFTDWLPTLLASAGVEPPRDLRLDGVDVLPLLQGERGQVCERRFWQWNRYLPHGECNAAMRDGSWKLVRPQIDSLMQVSKRDWDMDIDAKFNPDRYTDIRRDPLPERSAPPPPPSQLFDLASDPSESRDLAAAEPERVRRMEAELAAWFEDVERDRPPVADLQ
jgi:arylsulfatase A